MAEGELLVSILELSNVEMGTFRVRLVRKGEGHGLYHQLRWDEDEPAVEFYGPAADDERLADTARLGQWNASRFRHPQHEWQSVGWGGYCGVSPENSVAIAQWLERELSQPWTPPPPQPRPPSQKRANRPIELHDAGNRRVTIYVGGLFGYERIEAEWVHVNRGPYAQYVDAVFVEYLPRRKRRGRLMRITHRPDLVILLGWDHPDLQQAWEIDEEPDSSHRPNVKFTSMKTKYVSADPRYEQDFEGALNAYLEGLPLAQLLLDLRGETITDKKRAKALADPHKSLVFHPSGIRKPGNDAAQEQDAIGRTAVFISYHHGRDATARERFEREYGAAIQSSSIYPGELSTGPEVRREIRKRILGCDCVVVLIGRDTYTRRWVDWELRAAMTRDRNGTPKPVVGILLPELAALETILTPHMHLCVGESSSKLVKRADELSLELVSETGTTVPARFLDNLLGGYATLISWPASSGALLEAVASSGKHGRPVNSRRLLANNMPLPLGNQSESAARRVEDPQQNAGHKILGRTISAGGAEKRALRRDTTPSPAVAQHTPDHSGMRPSPNPEETKQAAVVPTGKSTGKDLILWTLGALQEYGPDAVLLGLDAANSPDCSQFASALRRHSHLLTSTDSETSMVATLLGRITATDPLCDFTSELSSTLHGFHLVIVEPAPDLPPAELKQVLRGGPAGIVAMVADPHQRWLAAVTWNGTLRVWNLKTGTIRHVLVHSEEAGGNSGRVLVAAPHGEWFASRGPDGLVDVWDPLLGKKLHTLTGKFGGVNAVAVDPRGEWLAIADSIGIVQLRSMPPGELLREIHVGQYAGRSMVVAPDGNWLAVGGSKVRIFATDTGDQLHELDAPGGGDILAVDPNGRWLSCGGGYGATVRVWPIPDYSPARNLTNRARNVSKGVHCIVPDPAGRWLATAGKEGTVRTWSVTSGAKELVLTGHPGDSFDGVRALTVAPDGVWLASGGTDRTIRVWDTATGQQRHHLTGHTGEVTALVTGDEGRWLASGSVDGTIRIWDTADSSAPDPHVIASIGSVTAMTTSPDGSWYAYAHSFDGAITICKTSTRRQISTSASHESHRDRSVTALQADPCGKWLASAGSDGTIRIWDPLDGSERYCLFGRSHSETKEVATRLAADPSGKWLACSGASSKIWIWSPITGERINTLWAAGGEINAVAVDPSGTWLASAGSDGSIRLWHVDESHPYRVLKGHQKSVHALVTDPAGGYIVSCGEEPTIRIWDLEDGTHAALAAPVTARQLATSPRGDWFASTGDEAVIRVWNPYEKRELCILAGHDATPIAMTSDPTGRYLASVGADGTTYVWEPSTGTMIASLRVDGPLTFARWSGGHLVVGGGQGVYLLSLHNTN
jgi:WD40 repeat protein